MWLFKADGQGKPRLFESCPSEAQLFLTTPIWDGLHGFTRKAPKSYDVTIRASKGEGMADQKLTLETLLSGMDSDGRLKLMGLLMGITDEDFEALLSLPEEELAQVLIAYSKREKDKIPEFLHRYL